jgi:hypothetical protein
MGRPHFLAWAAIDHARGYQILVDISVRQCGCDAADVPAAPFVLGDQEVKGSPLAEMVSDDVTQALAAESEDALAEFVVPSGEIVMPMEAHIVTAGKG